ncbi:hypothetical protein Hanom_Chr04g00310871 [Helianthus anomalus]
MALNNDFLRKPGRSTNIGSAVRSAFATTASVTATTASVSTTILNHRRHLHLRHFV